MTDVTLVVEEQPVVITVIDPSIIGPTGAVGKSAYEEAVDAGFVGDEATWLASLVGAQGPKGDKGDTGDVGPQGIQGIQGPQGDTGPQGIQGPQGEAGPQGLQGIQGPAGTNGLDGIDGDDGWSLVPAIISDGERRVLQVVDWTGGTGTKPATGSYIGATGLVAAIGDAIDIRGAAGVAGGDWTYVWLVSDISTDGVVFTPTALTFAAEANKFYEVDATVVVTSPGAATGIGICFFCPVDIVSIHGNIVGSITSANVAGTQGQVLNEQPIGLPFLSGLCRNVGTPLTGKYFIKTGATAGACTLNIRSEASGQAVSLVGGKSFIRYRVIG